MKKILLLLMIMLFCIPLVYSTSLAEYPDFFVSNNVLDVTIVVGDLAIASDTIGAIEIATSLTSYDGANKINVNAALSSEIEDIKNQNIIVVGGPCANAAAAELLNYPIVCSDSIPQNTGIIKLFNFNDVNVLLVAGSSAADTRRTSGVLANFEDYIFPNSDYMEVIKALETRVTIS